MKGKTKKLRPYIGIFGKRNVGKSSVFNRLARFNASIVSSEAGTTTDPVRKSMEHHFLGPILLIDTAGIDDMGDLGEKRIERTKDIIKTIDLAIIVILPGQWNDFEGKLFEEIKKINIPTIIVENKIDIFKSSDNMNNLKISALNGEGIDKLYHEISKKIPSRWLESKPIIRDFYKSKELAFLIMSSNFKAAPGRINFWHNRIIRDALDNDAQCVVLKENQFNKAYKKLEEKLKLIVVDIDVFKNINPYVFKNISMVSTTLIYNRFNGDLINYFNGSKIIRNLEKGDRVLLCDLTQKEYSLKNNFLFVEEKIKNIIGKEIFFDYVGRKDISEKIDSYRLVILKGEEETTNKKTMEKLMAIKRQKEKITSIDVALLFLDPIYRRLALPFMNKYSELDGFIENLGDI